MTSSSTDRLSGADPGAQRIAGMGGAAGESANVKFCLFLHITV